MSRNRDYHHYFQKASYYDLLAQYYKYSNPNYHIAYYQKHLQYMNMALQTRQNHQSQSGAGKVRFVHASIDALNVDIYIDGVRILQDFSYKEASNYLSLPAGRHQVDIYPANNMVSTVLSRKIDIASGKHYTLIPAGSVKNLKWLVLEDDPRVPRGEAKVRFIHLSPDAPAVDIAVKDRDVIFPNITFRKHTNYLALSPMTVDFEARISESSNVALPIPQVQIKPNKVYSILIVGSASGEPELEALIINN
ncbi:DUF4397 domain-containing protein [Bacillus sp. S/N-304-OC-R1]|uniref:DUF4397 domain-containing protein n=1 Tax=Bacillus sp. S/N-304-OC-R1 TaxID=2758034 RepID=UPI001C8ED011|nr:DUF4397 domain-containing protein [Bacillus sp. S/N-304-OC-R1]MBY0122718.1 DUF4397 domain-containing protein [Bacillus sp. S/N-304-OC-R1]